MKLRLFVHRPGLVVVMVDVGTDVNKCGIGVVVGRI
jgi:hypothetical protein